ncbi:MAG: type II toxin-antitoxin system RelE family toxin, partial [Gammaproteobacteria bacterium]
METGPPPEVGGYRLVYHPAVASDDILKMPADIQRRIARAIERRLSVQPERYGKPLSGTLRGYWKLRVGDYRVVFSVVRREVWI